MASANLRLDALGKAVADARRASQDRAELLEAARDDLRCMTRENQAVHAELAKTAEAAKKATAAQQRLDRDRETLGQQALRAKVERDDALRRYRAACREKDAARKGADAAALAQADLRGKLDAAEHKMRAMEAELENARKDGRPRTRPRVLEREVAQAAKTSDADQRTIDALRAEIQRLKTAPPPSARLRARCEPAGRRCPCRCFGRRPGRPADRRRRRRRRARGRRRPPAHFHALLAQARFAATNMPVPTAQFLLSPFPPRRAHHWCLNFTDTTSPLVIRRRARCRPRPAARSGRTPVLARVALRDARVRLGDLVARQLDAVIIEHSSSCATTSRACFRTPA